MNPIEHLWSHLKKKLEEHEKAPGGIPKLWKRIEREWEDIPKEVCQNLIESMPRRVEAVLKPKVDIPSTSNIYFLYFLIAGIKLLQCTRLTNLSLYKV
jgi:hypothetical protein